MKYNKYYWVNDISMTQLKNGYLLPEQTVQERVKEIAKNSQNIYDITDFALKIEDYTSRGWFSFSSPIWANFGLDRGLPIACNGSYINDSVESILETQAEVGMLTKMGAGTAAYFGNIRPRGSKIKNNGISSGSVHFMQLFDKLIDVISQGNVRRGNFAAYLPIDHEDIDEFLNIKTEGNEIQNIFHAVCIPDGWMQSMIDGDKDKRKVWAKVLKCRIELGLPYIFFGDNVNNALPKWYKDKGLSVKHSQLCSEILEYTDKDKTFVCDLASMNLIHYDEWKDTDAVMILTYLLDAVMEEYIQKTKSIPFLHKAHKFATEHRALGIGALGWHSFLQSKMIPFESLQALSLNKAIFKNIQENSIKASENLALWYGEPKMLKGYNRRNTTLQAVAPTKSSSSILGQASPSIEPLKSNYFIKDLAKSKFVYKNPYLEKLLDEKGYNTLNTWNIIAHYNGSVQNLDFLNKDEKDIFKTFEEIEPISIIQQAAMRQQFIDQGQSLNLMIHPDRPIKDINALYIKAWKLGIKTLYYQYSNNAAQNLSRDILNCTYCEG